jgi:Ca-activated chloride channel homolog
MSFDAPVVLALAPLIGGAVWFAAAWARRVRIRRAALWSEETVRRALGAGRLGPTALSLAAFLGVVALAGPRWGEEQIVAETRGLSLVMAIDISRSMLAEDASPNRLRRALREARRLVQDLDGDRLGLIAFAGSSYILSPLSIDGSALTLYLDALDPDVASEGGTGMAGALRQGGELLRASSELADRVLVVFTDGEAHDTLPGIVVAAQRLQATGVRLILVAEGGRAPTRIPVRDDRGALLGYQKDADGNVIETARRDDILGAAADAAQGTLVAADLPDQAGAVRDLVASYRRARASETRAERGRPRAWLPLMLAVMVLVAQAASRRTAALLGIALACLVAPHAAAQRPRPSPPPPPPHPRSAAEKAWDREDVRRAHAAYVAELATNRKDDAAWYNAGTAAMADSDAETAQASLAHAAASLDPDLRFRALYNLGLLALRQAGADSAGRDGHLGDAERAYREALLLQPRDAAAKWNLELAVRRRGGGSSSQSNHPQSGGGSNGPSGSGGGGGNRGGGGAQAALSESQAEQVLRSIGQQELKTRRDRTGQTRHAAEPGVKDW